MTPSLPSEIKIATILPQMKARITRQLHISVVQFKIEEVMGDWTGERTKESSFPGHGHQMEFEVKEPVMTVPALYIMVKLSNRFPVQVMQPVKCSRVPRVLNCGLP